MDSTPQTTMQLNEKSFDELRAYLEMEGFTFEERPYQVFLARKNGIVINLYQSGKVLIQGRDPAEIH